MLSLLANRPDPHQSRRRTLRTTIENTLYRSDELQRPLRYVAQDVLDGVHVLILAAEQAGVMATTGTDFLTVARTDDEKRRRDSGEQVKAHVTVDEAGSKRYFPKYTFEYYKLETAGCDDGRPETERRLLASRVICQRIGAVIRYSDVLEPVMRGR